MTPAIALATPKMTPRLTSQAGTAMSARQVYPQRVRRRWARFQRLRDSALSWLVGVAGCSARLASRRRWDSAFCCSMRSHFWRTRSPCELAMVLGRLRLWIDEATPVQLGLHCQDLVQENLTELAGRVGKFSLRSLIDLNELARGERS